MEYDFHRRSWNMHLNIGGRNAMCARCLGDTTMDPVEIAPRLLPNLQITELVDGGRIRYRLAGTAIVQAYGVELTGKYYDELFSGERLRRIEAHHQMICREKRPLFVCNPYRSARDVHLICTRIVMPLCEDGVNICKFLSAMSFNFPGGAYQWSGEWFGNDEAAGISLQRKRKHKAKNLKKPLYCIFSEECAFDGAA